MENILREYIKKNLIFINEDISNIETRTIGKINSKKDFERLALIKGFPVKKFAKNNIDANSSEAKEIVKKFRINFKISDDEFLDLEKINNFVTQKINNNTPLHKVVEAFFNAKSFNEEIQEKQDALKELEVGKDYYSQKFIDTQSEFDKSLADRAIESIAKCKKDIDKLNNAKRNTYTLLKKVTVGNTTIDMTFDDLYEKAESSIWNTMNDFLSDDHVKSSEKELEAKMSNIEKFNEDNNLNDVITYGELKEFLNITQSTPVKVAKIGMKIFTSWGIGQATTAIKDAGIEGAIESAFQDGIEVVTTETGADPNQNETSAQKLLTSIYSKVKSAIGFVTNDAPETIALKIANSTSSNAGIFSLPKTIENFISEETYKIFLTYLTGIKLPDMDDNASVDPDFYLNTFLEWVSSQNSKHTAGITFDFNRQL
jgi:hypothetical protein